MSNAAQPSSAPGCPRPPRGRKVLIAIRWCPGIARVVYFYTLKVELELELNLNQTEAEALKVKLKLELKQKPE